MVLPTLPRITLTWTQLEQYCLDLAYIIKKKNSNYKGIVIIARGGLGIAIMLSRLLDINLLDIACINSYDYKTNTKGEIHLIKAPELAIKDNGKNWLIIDDLIDSGDTYKYIKKILKFADFACLFHKNPSDSNIQDVIYVTKCSKDTWIEFPWETALSNYK